MTAIEVARSVIAKLDADEPIDWESEAVSAGLTVYRLQLLIRHATRGDAPEST